jgi:hypothetical protein
MEAYGVDDIAAMMNTTSASMIKRKRSLDRDIKNYLNKEQ